MLTAIQAAAKANTTRHTVEREIKRGNLKGEKLGGVWVIEDTEAERWAAQFRPYAGLRAHPAAS